MQKIVFILAIVPMLALNLVPGLIAMEEPSFDIRELVSLENISEASEKVEAEDKVVLGFYASIRSDKFLSGHLLTDLYAVPPERDDLPYEPPIA